MRHFLGALVVCLLTGATTANAASVVFSERVRGTISLSFGRLTVYDPNLDEPYLLDQSTLKAADLGLTGTWMGFDQGEVVEGFIEVIEDGGVLTANCSFGPTTINRCFSEGWSDSQSSSDGLSLHSTNHVSYYYRLSIKDGGGTYTYENDALYHGRLPDGSYWSNNYYGVLLTYNFSVVEPEPVPLPPSAALLGAALGAAALVRRRRKA